MTKILIIGSGAKGSLESAYARSLSRVEVSELDFFDIDKSKLESASSSLIGRALTRTLTPVSRRGVERQCGQFLADKKAEFDVILMFKATEFARQTLDSYRQHQRHAVWVNLNPDDPYSTEPGSSNSRIKGSLSFFDLYLTWSRGLVSKLRADGCKRVEYLPFGYDPDFHLPPPTNGRSVGEYISFVGAWDKQRQATLEKLADLDLRVFGSSWSHVPKHSPLFPKIVPRNLYGRELSEVIYQSRVSLNLLRPQNRGAHNMRTFEIPAMAGLMLTTRSEEQEHYFPQNKACLMFDSIDELRDQISRALGDVSWAETMRSRAHELVENHSYVDRARTLLRLIHAI